MISNMCYTIDKPIALPIGAIGKSRSQGRGIGFRVFRRPSKYFHKIQLLLNDESKSAILFWLVKKCIYILSPINGLMTTVLAI